MPTRKRQRLKDFNYSSEGMYFVTLCTNNRQRLFVGNDLCVVPQNEMLKKWLFELKNKFNANIDKYVIMPDHIHFILSITERHTGRSLPEMMQWFKTMTTNEYIKMANNGILMPYNQQIWQKSFHDRIIRGEKEYDEICVYIENNCLKHDCY